MEDDELESISEDAATEAGNKTKRVVGGIGRRVARFGKNVILRFLVAIGPIGWILLLVALGLILLVFLFGASFDFLLDERGSSGALSLDPALENPTVVQDGLYTVAALNESQAMIDAYYKYEACNSHQKLFVDSSGNEIWLSFDDADETSDFASLMDVYTKENYFYLSPYFIKMADELLNSEEFYYPEQIVKPVYAKLLPLESDTSKKYITALPIVDDGSDVAKAVRDGTPAYAVNAVSETATSTDNAPKREKLPENATLQLLAKSKSYEVQSRPTAEFPDTVFSHQGNASEPGIWDYGFGSILQYESKEKDKYIQCRFNSFDIHVHELVEHMYWDAASESWVSYTEEVCNGTIERIPVYSGDTAASLSARINGYETRNTTVACAPSYSVLSQMTNNSRNQHIEMKIQSGDSALARRQFSNATLNAAFGNKGKTTYPLKVAVISAAATFSGNLRYDYEMQETSQELRNEIGRAGFSEDYNDDYTQLVYSFDNCSGQELTASRSGLVWDVQPSSMPTEYSEPIGFQYLEDYANHYQVYVPDTIRQDMDFHDRINQPQEGAYQSSLDANKDGKLTVLDFLLKLGLLKPYSSTSLEATSGGGYTAGTTDAAEDSLLAQAGVANSAEGDVELLAKVIAAEAGPNKLDQLMVASVVMNRVYDSRFPNTLIGVISAPGQYSSWPTQIQSKTPSEQMRSSARQVINGEFALPANVLFQKADFLANHGAEGQIYCIVINGAGFYNHTYSIPRADATIAQTDRFGRTALSETQARALAEQLQQGDVSAGYSTSVSDSGILPSFPQGDVNVQLREDTVYYAVTGFDLVTALSNMQQLADPNSSTGFLHTLGSFLSDTFASIFDQVKTFLNYMENIWDDHTPNYYLQYNQNVPLESMRDIVYQAITFADKTSYSDTADSIDPNARVFLFIGKSAGIGMGTNGAFGKSFVNGTNSTIEGFTSPTGSYYQPLERWSETNDSVTLAVPEGTVVQAVGPGTITKVETHDEYFSVTQTASQDGKNYRFVYDGLAEVSVRDGARVEKGTQLGIAGDGGLKFSMYIDGVSVDPMKYFYQPSAGSSAAFANILNANGYVDEAAKNDLLAALCAANDSASFMGGSTSNASSYSVLDNWHSNFLSRYVGECTWWAYGRGRQYADEHGTSYVMNNGYGNGGDYYDRVQQAGDYAVGRAPRAGAWICWGKNGSYGHVGFVEAVEADGSIWVSESYRRLWDDHDGTGIALRKFVGPNYIYSAAYQFKGFIYLDQPLG